MCNPECDEDIACRNKTFKKFRDASHEFCEGGGKMVTLQLPVITPFVVETYISLFLI
jgi:hypothetical protein